MLLRDERTGRPKTAMEAVVTWAVMATRCRQLAAENAIASAGLVKKADGYSASIRALTDEMATIGSQMRRPPGHHLQEPPMHDIPQHLRHSFRR